jgi:NAD+ kinase
MNRRCGAVGFAAVPSGYPETLEAATMRRGHHEMVEPEEANALVALGGDGFVLVLMHQVHEGGGLPKLPIFGRNFGPIGILMSCYAVERMLARIAEAEPLEGPPC